MPIPAPAAAFKTTVKKNPEKYLPLLDYLFQNLSISIEYHLNGLEALSESDYDKFKVLEFFKVLIAQNLTGYAILGSIRIANYLVRHDVYDPAVMDYLFNKALNDPDPVPKEDAQQSKNDHLIGAAGALKDAAEVEIGIGGAHGGEAAGHRLQLAGQLQPLLPVLRC